MEKRRKDRNQIRSKKKKKIEEPPPISPPIDPSSSFRNWSDLPEELLVSILHRLLFSIPDLFAFAAVCRSWRSAAATSSSFRVPPLLLSPVSPGRSQWSTPARCRLQTLTGCNGLAAPSRTLTLRRSRNRYYSSMVSYKTLRERCVGCSCGQLIFVPAGCQNAVLADVFTGQEIQSPDFPDAYKHFSFSFGILTAPLASSSCFLLLVAARYPTSILCWAPGSSNDWSELHCRKSFGSRIISLVVFKGHVFALTELLDLIAVELSPMSLKELKITMPDGADKCHGHFDIQLVECGEELLLVCFFPPYRRPWRARAGVYRLDLLKHRWVKMESMGDWCLFIDAVRKHAIACSDPTSWGGRNNSIYFAGTGCDTWVVVPLDGEGLDSPFSVSNMKLSKWRLSVWVYPRFAREGFQIEGRAAFSEPSEDDAL